MCAAFSDGEGAAHSTRTGALKIDLRCLNLTERRQLLFFLILDIKFHSNNIDNNREVSSNYLSLRAMG